MQTRLLRARRLAGSDAPRGKARVYLVSSKASALPPQKREAPARCEPMVFLGGEGGGFAVFFRRGVK